MAQKKHEKHNRLGLYISIIVVMLLVVVGMSYGREQSIERLRALLQRNVQPTLRVQPRNVTMTGQTTCLHHKGNPEVVTLECAYGFKSDDGKYYSLKHTGEGDSDTMLTSPLYTAKRTEITGILTNESSTTYETAGTVTVSSYKVLEPAE